MAPDIEGTLIEFFEASSSGLAAVYLFGSTARGTSRPDSDIDLGLLFSDLPDLTLHSRIFDLEAALERRLGRPVDAVVLNRAPMDLRARVLRNGRLILDIDRSRRIAFEVRTRNEAFDLEPILQRYRAPRQSSP